jgi:hypothetical protein
MIRKGVEALLEKGEPLPMLKPTQAWRITGHSQGHRIDLPTIGFARGTVPGMGIGGGSQVSR